MTALFDALNGALATHATEGRGRLDRARVCWAAAVGPDLARHSEVLGLQGALLRVGVRDRTRRDFLFHQRQAVVERLARAGVRLAGLRLEDLPPLPFLPPPSAPERAPADARTREIRDPALRDALDGLLHAASLRDRGA